MPQFTSPDFHDLPASAFYPKRHAELSGSSARISAIMHRARLAGVVCLVLAGLAALGTTHRTTPGWLILPPVVMLSLSLRRYLRARREQEQLRRLIDLYQRALARLDDSQPQSGHTGEAFRIPTHLYDRDLAVLGPDSLFGMLATVRTGVGQRGLAYDLLHLPSRDETLSRQQAIQELSPRNQLREHIHLLGISQFQQVAASFFDAWIADPPPLFHPAIRWSLAAASTALIALVGAGLWHIAPWGSLIPNILAILAFQSAMGLYLRPRVLPLLNAAGNLSNQMRMFRDGLALLQANTFTAPKLRDLQAASHVPAHAVAQLKKLEGHLIIVEQRTKEWFLIASLLLCAGTHTAISLAGWKRRHAAAMVAWLAAWGEFESLNAFATYAYEHPANVYPEILPQGTRSFEAVNLAHPLLGPEAVPNDIALGDTTSLYLISGSNMAGKSTLLRTIGLNAILAAAGAPIRATAARLSPPALGASLALTDSLAEGKSKFLAEVERLHAILELSKGTASILFLIDEIFSGTNSLDRRVAAEAVARTLVERKAIGALSTHDLTLTAMADDPSLRAANLHMASGNPDDPLDFDYRLKPGINPGSNALAILRLIGIHLPSAPRQ